MIVKRLPTLGEYERQALLGWGDDVFLSGVYGLTWRPKELHLVLYIDTEPASKCGLIKQTISVGGCQLDVAGLGGVVTAPKFHNQGLASRILEEVTLLVETEWMLPAMTLFCREPLVPFYAQRGWQLLQEPVEFLQPEGKIVSPVKFMYFTFANNFWPAGRVQIDSFPW